MDPHGVLLRLGCAWIIHADKTAASYITSAARKLRVEQAVWSKVRSWGQDSRPARYDVVWNGA
jgi:hypothetical protein